MEQKRGLFYVEREVIEFNEIREIKEIKEFKEYREEVIYSANTLAIFSKFLKLLIFPNHPPPNFLSEWCRCGATHFISGRQFFVRRG